MATHQRQRSQQLAVLTLLDSFAKSEGTGNCSRSEAGRGVVVLTALGTTDALRSTCNEQNMHYLASLCHSKHEKNNKAANQASKQQKAHNAQHI